MKYDIKSNPPTLDTISFSRIQVEASLRHAKLCAYACSAIILCISIVGAYNAHLIGIQSKVAVQIVALVAVCLGWSCFLTHIFSKRGTADGTGVMLGAISGGAAAAAIPGVIFVSESGTVFTFGVVIPILVVFFLNIEKLRANIHRHLQIADESEDCISVMKARKANRDCDDYMARVASMGRMPTRGEVIALDLFVRQASYDCKQRELKRSRQVACRAIKSGESLFDSRENSNV